MLIKVITVSFELDVSITFCVENPDIQSRVFTIKSNFSSYKKQTSSTVNAFYITTFSFLHVKHLVSCAACNWVYNFMSKHKSSHQAVQERVRKKNSRTKHLEKIYHFFKINRFHTYAEVHICIHKYEYLA